MPIKSRRVRPAPVGGPFDVRHVAARYGVGLTTVRGWIASGELTAVNVSRSARSKKPRWRISREAIEAFESQRRPVPVPQRVHRKKPADVIEFYH